MGHPSTIGGPTRGPWLLGKPAIAWTEGCRDLQASESKALALLPPVVPQAHHLASKSMLLGLLNEAFPNHVVGNGLGSPASCIMLGFSLQHLLLRLSISYLLFILSSITCHFPITLHRHGVWVHSCVPSI